MTTTDILLTILTVLLSIFFILLISTVIIGIKLLGSIRRVVARAEEVVDSVESATEVLRDAKGQMAFFKVVANIIKLVNKVK